VTSVDLAHFICKKQIICSEGDFPEIHMYSDSKNRKKGTEAIVNNSIENSEAILLHKNVGRKSSEETS